MEHNKQKQLESTKKSNSSLKSLKFLNKQSPSTIKDFLLEGKPNPENMNEVKRMPNFGDDTRNVIVIMDVKFDD